MPSIDLNFKYLYGEATGEIITDYLCRDKVFPSFVSLLRKKFTKKRIVKDMKFYINELQEEINVILLTSFNSDLYRQVSRLCNDWYSNSEEKQKVRSLTKQVNNS